LIRYPGNIPAEPTFALDISDLAEKKAAAIRCYRSQLVTDGARAHLVQRLDILERAQVRDRFYGARTGCALAEPYVVEGPVLLRDLGSLFA
jgi:LmbE family N-acetylglucosaminyl deacetylase